VATFSSIYASPASIGKSATLKKTKTRFWLNRERAFSGLAAFIPRPQSKQIGA
jgi:hypothetical protein